MLSNIVQRTVASVAISTDEDLSKVHPDVIPRSIIVTGFEPSTTPDKLLLHFQRKQDGGGDIESIARSYRRRAVVITFRKPEVVTSVLNHRHKVDEVELTVKPFDNCANPLTTQKPGVFNGTNDNQKEDCPICLCDVSNPRSLKCKHVFCSPCLQQALDACNRCPVCQEPQGALRGNQPPGNMTSRAIPQSVPGYEGYGTIVINYSFQSGIQGREHPNPGQSYSGTSRVAYLPNTPEGCEVLQLLRRAFNSRLVFTVGTSATTGLHNQITWNDIHHKTTTHGGPYGFGYPDPDYLRRVREELAAKGIK